MNCINPLTFEMAMTIDFKRWRFWIPALVVFALTFPDMVPFASGQSAKPERPNILFLMTDQHRGDALGADGNQVIQTPNLDRLADEGARFRCAYSTVPSCTPARSAILTGLSPWHHGLPGFSAMAVKYEREMPQMLADAGYQTVGIGKMHFFPQRNGHGFETMILDESGRVDSPGFVSDYRIWFKEVAPDLNPEPNGIGWNSHRAAPYAIDEKFHPTVWTGDRAVEFLEKYDDERPLFLKVSFARPHSPYDAPQRYWDMYADRDDIPLRAVGDWCERHAQRGKRHADDLWQGDLGEDAARLARIGYYGNITMIDDQIGRILKVLEDRKMLDNTLILMTSDHGDMLGDHHLWRKTYGYDASARVPMLLRWGKTLSAAETDGRNGGLVLSQPVELRDIMPTFLDVAGVAYEEEWFDGRNLLSLIRNPEAPWREYIDLEHATCYAPENNWTGLTDGKIKYIYYAPDAREQLFDLAADPNEEHNLAPLPEHGQTLELWRSRMEEHLQERGEPYVKDGKLLPRPQGIIRSPNYPVKQ